MAHFEAFEHDHAQGRIFIYSPTAFLFPFDHTYYFILIDRTEDRDEETKKDVTTIYKKKKRKENKERKAGEAQDKISKDRTKVVPFEQIV